MTCSVLQNSSECWYGVKICLVASGLANTYQTHRGQFSRLSSECGHSATRSRAGNRLMPYIQHEHHVGHKVALGINQLLDDLEALLLQ